MDKEIIIGKIVAPHGVRGDIRILPLTEKPDLFLDLEYLLLEGGKKLTVKNISFTLIFAIAVTVAFYFILSVLGTS